MEFCNGFEWPVPLSFRDALRICRFQSGDLLYTDSVAYEDWSSARCKAIQVMAAKGLPGGDEDSFQLFQKNWNAGCTVSILDLTTLEKEEHETTHGRLFTALWKGKIESLFDENAAPPFGIRECLKKLRNVSSAPSTGAEYSLVTDWSSPLSLSRERRVKHAVEGIDGVETAVLEPSDFGIYEASPLLRILKLKYTGRRIEAFRDALKKALWPPAQAFKPTTTIEGTALPRTFDVYMAKTSSTGKSVPSISDFGVFRRVEREQQDIVAVPFMHGPPIPYYLRYRLSSLATAQAPQSVTRYIETMVDDCPNHVFREYSNTSHDGCRGPVIGDRLDVVPWDHRHLLELARNSYDEDSSKSRHSNLQKWFVANDPRTLAVELPVWMRAHEFVDFERTFGCRRGMAGHIDLLRVEGSRIWIWDYKPKAKNEKHAHKQVFLYAIMLSLRTGVPMERLGAGYFDESNVYRVKWS